MIQRTPLLLVACGFILPLTAAPLSADSPARVLPPASERFAMTTSEDEPHFQRHVIPLLGRLGCNGRSCHGSFQGQGGLRLSLFGYDFRMDHAALTASASGSHGARVDRAHPEQSLIVRKPSLQVAHEGGQRFAADSWQNRLLTRWIESGARAVAQAEVLKRIEVEPSEIVFGEHSQPVTLRVVAVWEDNLREDVTPLCRFRSNNDAIATVDPEGVITPAGPGDTHVVVFYDNGINAVPIIKPHPSPQNALQSAMAETVPTDVPALESAANAVDALVLAKLNKLRIIPSPSCTDTEFLRRVSIDLTGTLPSVDEVEAFLADQSADKRARKVDELLEREAYAAWWANKLCDFTGCNPSQQAELGQETAAQWYMWIYERLRQNVPYDEIVSHIVLATSRAPGQSYGEYAQQVSAYFRSEAPADFTKRPNLPHYWTRRSMQKPEEAAEAFAHNFLGIRLQCARCHKHPFAPWTQDDFQQFSRFFENVEFGVQPDSRDDYRDLAQQVGLKVRDESGMAVSREVLKLAERGRTIPWRELYIARREQPITLQLFQTASVALEADEDPREPIMDWMREPDNPWFARAFVNRVWASYFHVGIIDPPDDLNPANPPSNPQLLQKLVSGFREHGYDMKWLHRQIVTSATYQRSWRPNVTNRDDRRNFSRRVPRRLPAEVVYDAVKQALAATDRAESVRTDLTRRAIGELSMRLAGTYAMQVFGKPDRVANCDCERVNQPSLLQAIFLQNDPLLQQRLDESGWLQEIAEQEAAGTPLDHTPLVREAWLRTVNRPPTDAETERALAHLESAPTATAGLRDVLWALINTKEFLLIQ